MEYGDGESGFLLVTKNSTSLRNIFDILSMQSRLAYVQTLRNSTVFNFGFNHLDAIIFQIKVDFTSDGKHKITNQSVNTLLTTLQRFEIQSIIPGEAPPQGPNPSPEDIGIGIGVCNPNEYGF